MLNADYVPSYYITELSTDLNGRPDITGLDSDGKKIVIIEGKYWANLTNNQPVNYLKELPKNGHLLFLAPQKRILSLSAEMKRRIGDDDTRIYIYSWLDFLNLIEKENIKDFDSSLSSDLSQLEELCKKMDSEGLPPLSQSDLDPMHGRISYQLASLIDECYSLLKIWGEANIENLQRSSSKYGYGFSFRAYGLECKLYFSNHKWFVRETKTPFWLAFKGIDSNSLENILRESFPTHHENSVGIELKPGMDKKQIIEHIVCSTKDIITRVAAKSPAPTAPPPYAGTSSPTPPPQC